MEKRDIKKFIKNFRQITCPICNDFVFTKPQDDIDAIEYLNGNIQCSQCGWKYDINQFTNFNLKDGLNEMSVNEYIIWYKSQISNDPNFNYLDTFDKYKPVPHKCPVCNEFTFSYPHSYEICRVCGWQNDGSNENDEQRSANNNIKYSKYKEMFIEKRKENPKYNWFKEIEEKAAK